MSNSSTDPDLTKRRIVAAVLSVLALLGVLAFTWWIDGQDGPDETSAAASSTASAAASDSAPASDSASTTASRATTSAPSSAPDIPDHVLATLDEIDSGRWPESANAPGTRGGDTFRNREGNLPTRTATGKRVTYKEWDVNPRKRGQGRDAERIVTGSDGSAWYTADHYRSFDQIRGPSA
ncbi:ribonuclease domain-containing protein [Gordonia hydrophobica]|uniref:Ribonuclease domain-containing protein n=1 Tax=Gordonia hydrophobica TaxID=40516 RepID=A0ABZ2U4G2_9ACTN|nr:ribonuclease domain-containing protein [Gordonia hydrophobica]MBM7368062.1 guanyl-specific ribonuclease Sa [Gordonia hydrophobica]